MVLISSLYLFWDARSWPDKIHDAWLALGLALAGPWPGPGWPLAWPLAGPWPGPWLALGLALGWTLQVHHVIAVWQRWQTASPPLDAAIAACIAMRLSHEEWFTEKHVCRKVPRPPHFAATT